MAQRKTNNSGKRKTTTRKSSGNQRRPSSGRTSTQAADVTVADYWLAFSKSRFFFPVMTILVITVIVLIDLLISWNNYDRFFIMLGIELILAAAVWIIGLVLSLGSESSSDEGTAS
ncbi:MAG: hypothetical protein K6F49_04955 [Saccharofermentans sp.]|nr:hypothetical protein [Saccharofermentans sp.]